MIKEKTTTSTYQVNLLNAVLRQKREKNLPDISVEIKAEGLDELKKLLNEALDQVEQLKNTLTRINKIKIRVDS